MWNGSDGWLVTDDLTSPRSHVALDAMDECKCPRVMMHAPLHMPGINVICLALGCLKVESFTNEHQDDELPDFKESRERHVAFLEGL